MLGVEWDKEENNFHGGPLAEALREALKAGVSAGAGMEIITPSSRSKYSCNAVCIKENGYYSTNSWTIPLLQISGVMEPPLRSLCSDHVQSLI
jgi:hypothetical protein